MLTSHSWSQWSIAMIKVDFWFRSLRLRRLNHQHSLNHLSRDLTILKMSGFYLRSCLDHFHMNCNSQQQNSLLNFLTPGSCFDFLLLYRLWTGSILQSEAIQDVLSYLSCELFRHEAVTSTHAFSLDFFQAWDWVSYSYFSSFLTKFRQLVHTHTVATCAFPEKNKSKENTNREVLAGWRQERRWILHLLL